MFLLTLDLTISRIVCRMLRNVLLKRLGTFLPVENHRELLPKDFRVRNENDTEVTFIEKQDSEQVKEFMLRTFYEEAPIPKVLNLSRNCSKTRQFLDKNELNLFINSGVSLKVKDKSQNLLGIGFSAAWRQNPRYEIIGADVKNWHNTAAKIAQNYPENERHLIWRELQYQHIYDLAQRVLIKSKKSLVFYLAMLYLSPEIRSSKIGENALIQTTVPGCSLLCQSNFRAFDKTIYQKFKNPVLLDEVKYAEEELILNANNNRAFSPIDHLDGIRFYADL
jgi:hypothetical protein